MRDGAPRRTCAVFQERASRSSRRLCPRVCVAEKGVVAITTRVRPAALLRALRFWGHGNPAEALAEELAKAGAMVA